MRYSLLFSPLLAQFLTRIQTRQWSPLLKVSRLSSNRACVGGETVFCTTFPGFLPFGRSPQILRHLTSVAGKEQTGSRLFVANCGPKNRAEIAVCCAP